MKRIAYVAVGLVVLASQNAYASSLPQMDTTWYANQLLWLAISFGLLYACVSLIIAPAIQSVLTTRDHAIADAIHEAELAKKTAESTRSDATISGQAARTKAGEIMAKTLAENNAEAAEAIAKLDHDLSRRADHAAAVLDDAVKKANTDLEDAVSSLANAMAARLMGQSAEPDAAPKLKLAKR